MVSGFDKCEGPRPAGFPPGDDGLSAPGEAWKSDLAITLFAALCDKLRRKIKKSRNTQIGAHPLVACGK
jgi:hypothetical protein